MKVEKNKVQLDPITAFIAVMCYFLYFCFLYFIYHPIKKSNMNNSQRYILAYLLLVISLLIFKYFLETQVQRTFDEYSFLSYAFALILLITSMIQFSAMKNPEKPILMNKERIITEIEGAIAKDFTSNSKTYIRQLLENQNITITNIAVLICDDVNISRTENKNKIIEILAKYK